MMWKEEASVVSEKLTAAQAFNLRNDLKVKHGVYFGATGSGKTLAVQNEIKEVLSNTEDNVIVIDNGGYYQEFCNEMDGQFIEVTSSFIEKCPNKNKSIKVNTTRQESQSRLTVLSLYKVYEDITLEDIHRIYQYVHNKMQIRHTWTYIDSITLLSEESFLIDLIDNSGGVISVLPPNYLFCENEELLSVIVKKCHDYIRLFQISEMNMDILANYIPVKSSKDRKDVQSQKPGENLIIIRNNSMAGLEKYAHDPKWERMKEYSLKELEADLEFIGPPMYEYMINNSFHVVINLELDKQNYRPSQEYFKDGFIAFSFKKKKRSLFSAAKNEYGDFLHISKGSKLYITDELIYHDDLQCIKCIHVYDEADQFFGVLHYPTYKYM